MSLFKNIKAENKTSDHDQDVSCGDTENFNAAQGWHYDRYESQWVQANRWLLAFWCQTGITFLLVLGFVLLLPLKTLVPLIIRQNSQTHEVFVEKLSTKYVPHQNEIESDLVRYVTLRETYSSFDLPLRYKQVLLETSNKCALEYQRLQSNNNPLSPVNVYGVDGTRIIHIEDVIFLNNQAKKTEPTTNLAKVDFVSTETIHEQTVRKYWVATIAWEYRGTPKDKEAAWHNWNGFTVTSYRVDQRSVHEEKR